MRRAVAILLGTLAALSACVGSPGAAPGTQRPTAPGTQRPTAAGTPAPATGSPTHPDHVVVAIFENKAYRQINGNPQAPYLNTLIGEAATFTNAHAETHPSQPNYIALFSGSTQGVTDDRCLGRFHGRPNLGSQLIDAGYTFTGYSEDLPSPGYTGCTYGRYAAKHNPWVDFDNVPAAANQPYTAWPADLSRLPTVAFVVPNLCDDMHDCGVGTGDAWANAHLDPYLRWAGMHNSLLMVTFDENDGGSGNQILTLIAGAGVTPAVHTESINHYSLLRTIESRYGLAPLTTATPIDLG
jgi:phosphatidylinositol-3-phosphatase